MTVYLVSRHPGAIDWMRTELAAPDARVLSHVGAQRFESGDVVAGVLPLWLAARACGAGATALSLDLDLAPEQRGRELDAAELRAAGARLVRYEVKPTGMVAGRSS
ncbi:CRISPR-associated protein Csx16 [Rubrivivax benzoatilyticus]|nr:CRISPR-associated protein Csx16 [Rubrivivax benzoatilyticus]EGJ09038.1 CRISPR-associated protein, VVA1548 family [Rubrivivax benzoatilyticus JA2 = ATCC BAA-35]